MARCGAHWCNARAAPSSRFGMSRLRLIFQRALVFALGALTAWLIAFVIFDFADKRLPVLLAVAVTYGAGAYVVLPRAVRIGLRILKRGRVPSYTMTGDGLPADPINLVLVGAYCDLRAAFAAAGWSEADRLGLASSLRMIRAFALKRPYLTAPFSTLYLFDRGQDVGFQLPIGGSPRKRHHVRFWGLPADRAEAAVDTPEFWLASNRPSEEERALWIGAATKDVGVSLTRLTFQVTHATDPNTNEERDFLIAELHRAAVIEKIRSHLPGERIVAVGVNRYLTDGFVAVADLCLAERSADADVGESADTGAASGAPRRDNNPHGAEAK